MPTFPMDNDVTLFQLMATHLYSAVLSDALDQMGQRDQAMSADIRPVFASAIVVGRAVTLQSIDVYEHNLDDYETEIEAVDSLCPGNVIVASTQQSKRTCLWGELLSTASVARGARGAIIDGYTRDVRMIHAMGFPVFATGMHPVDSAGRGRVIDYNCPINCGGVRVCPGDIVFGDLDGVVVIPNDIAEEVVQRAANKVEGENATRERLQQGATLRQVYDQYGIL